jgi:hypothetical protein
MVITLYGCSAHFRQIAAISERDHRTATVSIRTRFVNAAIRNGLGYPRPIPDNDLIISEEVVPIGRLYFADIGILLEDNKNPPEDQICRITTAVIGDLWDEFVRSFIDSGAFVGVRLACCGTKQFRWSCEGHRQ